MDPNKTNELEIGEFRARRRRAVALDSTAESME